MCFNNNLLRVPGRIFQSASLPIHPNSHLKSILTFMSWQQKIWCLEEANFWREYITVILFWPFVNGLRAQNPPPPPPRKNLETIYKFKPNFMYIKSVSFFLNYNVLTNKKWWVNFFSKNVVLMVFTFIKNTYLPLLVIFMIDLNQNKTMDFII